MGHFFREQESKVSQQNIRSWLTNWALALGSPHSPEFEAFWLHLGWHLTFFAQHENICLVKRDKKSWGKDTFYQVFSILLLMYLHRRFQVIKTQQDYRKINSPHTFNRKAPLTQACTYDAEHFCNMSFCLEEFLSYLHLDGAERVTVFFLTSCGKLLLCTVSWMAALIWLTPDQWCF